jgi:hypothetical protein
MGWFKCRHKKMSDIKSDGYQYCLSCNRAFVPGSHSKEVHILEEIDVEAVIFPPPEGHWRGELRTLVYQKCKKCGMRFTYDPIDGSYRGHDPKDTLCTSR